MAKKVIGQIKLHLPGGQATPAPPVGPALGQHGLNIMDFCKAFNARTQKDQGIIIPVVITVYADRSYSFIMKSPPASILVKKAAGLATSGKPGSGSKEPNKHKVAQLSWDQVRQVAQEKIKDMNTTDLEAAARTIAGTARSMGVTVE